MSDFFGKWREGLERSRKAAFGRIANFFGVSDITDDSWDELEALLIQADLGLETTEQIISSLRHVVDEQGLTNTAELESAMRNELIKRLDTPPELDFHQQKPAVILLAGVNGSGKTTTAAKLAYQWQKTGKSVLMAAADTFRAAAIDQLQVWGERLQVPVITGAPNADPGAVAYDSVQAAVSRGTDYLLIDTAGRLQTRFNLMEELKKVHRVVGKALPGAPHAVWLVLDATTGQNALSQAKAFKESVKVTGVILTKLDSSARGGMAFAIQEELNLPILYAGLGEKPEDLRVFDRGAFVDGIFSKK